MDLDLGAGALPNHAIVPCAPWALGLTAESNPTPEEEDCWCFSGSVQGRPIDLHCRLWKVVMDYPLCTQRRDVSRPAMTAVTVGRPL